MRSPPVGLRHSETIRVSERLSVPGLSLMYAVFADMPAVFATAHMIAFVEATCIAALRPFLEGSERTVGIHVDMTHSAATPLGMQVTADVELEAVEGRTLLFKVVCRDEVDTIGRGFHKRALIDASRFTDRVNAKAAQDRPKEP